jgi:hypothetical protein
MLEGVYHNEEVESRDRIALGKAVVRRSYYCQFPCWHHRAATFHVYKRHMPINVRVCSMFADGNSVLVMSGLAPNSIHNDQRRGWLQPLTDDWSGSSEYEHTFENRTQPDK